MKILAFSDWRIQSLLLLQRTIEKENPDLILYAGDDLERLVPNDGKVCLKTHSHFIEVDLDNPQEFFENDNVIPNPLFNGLFSNLQEQDPASFLYNSDPPFYYVIGNDNFIIEKEGIQFIQSHMNFSIDDEIYHVYENLEGKLNIISKGDFENLIESKDYLHKIESDRGEHIDFTNHEELINLLSDDSSEDLAQIGRKFELKAEFENHLRSYTKNDRIYVKISPLTKFDEITIGNDKITLYGSGCTQGKESQIINPPDRHADIYLSHLPPLGKCDLLSRFGINHVGSKKLLDAVKEFNPKMVICGHSHIWGGLTEKIGRAAILNVSSQDNSRYKGEGNYAIINTKNWTFTMRIANNKELGLLFLKQIRGASTIKKKLKKKKEGWIYVPRDMIKLIYGNESKENEFFQAIFTWWDPDTKRVHAKGKHFTPENLKSLNPKKRKLLLDFITIKLDVNLEQYYDDIKKAKHLFRLFSKEMTFDEGFHFLDQVDNLGIDSSRVRGRLKSFQTGDVEELKGITVDPEQHYFIDIETGLAHQYFFNTNDYVKGRESNPSRVWLIGIGNIQETRQFLYPQEKNEFFSYLEDNAVTALVSWTRYDHKALRSIFEEEKIEMTFMDACQRTSNVLTSGTYKLHELYHIMFQDDEDFHDIIPGRIAGLYADHLLFSKRKCPFCHPKKDSILEEIKKRNLLDVEQMIEICKRLYKREEFECPNCGFRSKDRKTLKNHVENNSCWHYLARLKSKEKKKAKNPLQFIQDNGFEGAVKFNENNVYECKCGKVYLSPSLKYIKAHMKNCPICNASLKNDFKNA